MEQLIWIKPERCTTCGYSLVAHDIGDVCPACGRLVQAVGVPDPLRRFSAARYRLRDNPDEIARLMLLLALPSGCLVVVILIAVVTVVYAFG